MASSNRSGRVKVEKLTGGLNTLVDPLMGDLSQSPDLYNVRVETGLLRQRKGYRILGREPSRLTAPATAKTRAYLTFTAASSTFANAGLVNSFTMGTKWTVLFEVNFGIAANQSASTKTLFFLRDTDGNRPVEIQAIGDGTNIKIRAIVKDRAATTTATLTGSTNQPAASWATLSNRFIRLVRDGATITLYIGESQEAQTTSFSTIEHGSFHSMSIFRDTVGPVYADGVFYGLTIVNRVLTEEESYWGINYPMDPGFEDNQILGCWPAIQGVGTTLTDYSKYANHMAITSATWTVGGTNRFARGLGLFTYRRRDGSKWHVVGCSRTATEDTGPTAPSGAIYIWQADQDFYPFYFGGLKSANDTTASLDGLSFLHRLCFLNYRDILYAMNGSDYSRQYYSAWGYLGGTAPGTAPIIGVAAGASNWKYCFTWYNATTGKETARSPTADATAATTGTTVQTFATSDTQFTKCRIYRTTSGGTVFYLCGEVALGAVYTELAGMTDATLQKQPLLAGPDGSAAGNFLVKRSYLLGGPSVAPTLASGGAGNVDVGIHYWYYSWYDPATGNETGLSLAGTRTIAGAAETINVSTMALPPSGSVYTQMRLYRTKAGAYLLYRVGTFSASTTVIDNVADATLADTIETYALPPKTAFAVPFASRVFYGGDPNAKGTFWWSAAGQGEDVTWTSGHDPNPGAELTGIHASQFNIFFHYSDGRIFVMDHPGPDAALEQFVPFNCREYSALGAAVGHYTIQKTDIGTVWLALDGFKRATANGPEDISPTIGPSFLTLNRQRGRYACSLYDTEQKIYRCWLSRGNKRLNDECFVLDLRNFLWVIDDDPSADAAAVMLDGREGRHYCVLRENGVLVELAENQSQDGDGTGQNSGTPGGASMTRFSEWASRVGPVGYDGGYPIWFVKSDGTIAKRTALAVTEAVAEP